MSRPFHGGNLKEATSRYKIAGDKIIDFSANINPLGLSLRVKEALSNSIETALRYPDPYCEGLKKEIAAHLEVDDRNILVGNGSCNLIYLIPQVLTPRRVLIPLPAFSEYEYSVKINQGTCEFLSLEETTRFCLKPESVVENLKDIDAVFICNPHNPTGRVMVKEALLFLISECEKENVGVVVDEAFVDFAEDYDNLTLVKEAVLRKSLLVLRSLTKFFGLPGLRVGYLVGERRLIDRISLKQPPWMVNALGQSAAREALKDQEYIEETRKFIRQERDYLFSELQRLDGIEPYPSEANFIFCRLTHERMDSTLLTDELGRQGILIRDCSTFRGLDRKFIRLAVRRREENVTLISALGKIFRSSSASSGLVPQESR
ncbi:MAG: threonine-phosphate decarboxylase CobD [Pseudomonadota bacterium]